MPVPFPKALYGLALLLGLGGWFDGLFHRPAPVAPAAVREALAARWADARPSLSSPLAPTDSVTRALYAARGFAPLWPAEADRLALRTALAEAHLDGFDDTLLPLDRLDRLAQRYARIADQNPAKDRPDPRATLLAEWDALLTESVLRYGEALVTPAADPARLYPDRWHPSSPPHDVLTDLHTALAAGDAAATVAALDALRPPHPEYHTLRRALARLREAARHRAPIPHGLPLRPGDTSIRVPYLRGRLAALGYLDAPLTGWTAETPYRFDSTLAVALARFQNDEGLAVDTTLSDSTLAALEVDVEARIRTLRLNLERWRWLPRALGDLHLLANLPAYDLVVRHRAAEGGWREALRMPAAIGMTTWATPVLSDTLRAVVFNPTWTVPASIQASDILPMARADSGATLVRRGFSVFAGDRVIDPLGVDWSAVEPGQYRIVQRPGPSNPLGRIKFVMPNAHAVLIHDTNKPSHFAAEARAFSNGCIQAADPEALARTLLRIANAWPDAYVDRALAPGVEVPVPLDRPVPVHFVYFTAWPSEDGVVRFYDDVYGYDPPLADALFGAPEGEAVAAATHR